MSRIQEIPIGKIEVGEHEQRLDLEDDGIEDLARSIGRLGVIVPLHVKHAGDSFTVVCGHRRLRASRRIGLERVPCIMVGPESGEAEEMSFAENFFRRDLTPVELACALKDCVGKQNLTVKEMAAGFHRTEHWVHSMIAVADWPADILEAIHNERISVSAASNLVCVTDDSYRTFLVRNAVEQGATARTTASWLQAWRAMQPQEEAITAVPGPGTPHSVPAIPQAPCLCCAQQFPVNMMSHVPVCGGCIQTIREVGLSGGE